MDEQLLTPLISTAVAVAVLISVCLVAGLLMRTRAGKGLENFFETSF
jgi:preprotein translocase subunit SecG